MTGGLTLSAILGDGQPMRARSVVFDIFGDYVRRTGGRISLRQLTPVLGAFGVPADSTQVVMSRLAREGWFTIERNGRTSVYQPSPKGWELLDSGLERIMSGPPTTPWHGRWYMAIFSVPESQRAIRNRLKTELSWLGFGQLAPSTWISAHNRLEEAEQALAAEDSIWFDLFEVEGGGRRTDIERAMICWDLTSLGRDYQAFGDKCQTLIDEIAPRLVGRDALIQRTELIHEYRRFPFRDPGLPPELLPPDWPAFNAHQLFIQAFNILEPEALRHFQSITSV